MATDEMNFIDWIAFVLVVVGGLNWGLVGIGNFLGGNWDLVNLILGSVPFLRDLVYIVVGISAVYAAIRIATNK